MTTVLTIVGLVFTLAGTALATKAFAQTWRQHGGEPLWPWAARKWLDLKRWARQLWPWGPEPQTIQVSASLETRWNVGSPRLIQSGLPIPEDRPLSEQIRLLIQRVAQVEDEANEDRKQHKADVRAIHKEANDMGQRMTKADQDLKALATALAIGTIRLQIMGLVLVGLGTVLMALPVLFGSE